MNDSLAKDLEENYLKWKERLDKYPNEDWFIISRFDIQVYLYFLYCTKVSFSEELVEAPITTFEEDMRAQ